MIARNTLCLCLVGLVPGWLLAADGPLEAFQGEPKFEIQRLFAGGRQPNVVVAMDGTVLATFRTGDALQVRRSEDGGKTWGDPITLGKYKHIFSGGGVTVDETSSDVFMFAEKYEWPKTPSPPTIYRSKDQGKTWQIQETVIHPAKNGDRPTMHMAEHGITLRYGKRKGRLLRPARFYGPADTRQYLPTMYNTAIYSDDGGNSWQTSDRFPELGTGEGTVAELSDGRIYYNSRRHADSPGIKCDPCLRWEAWSHDGGETWKDAAVCKILPDGARKSIGAGSGCMAGLVRLPVKGRDVLLYSNCDSQGSDRKDVSVWVSFDGAKTWPLKRRVFDGPSAYSSLNAGRAGTPSAGWAYLQLEGGKKHRYDGGHLARFNLSWLLGGKKTGDGEVPEWVK